MFGFGFVWFVKIVLYEYKVLSIYFVGSLYFGVYWCRQGSDMNIFGNQGLVSEYYCNRVEVRRMNMNDLLLGGIVLEFVLCLNIWEYVWLLDWGVGCEGYGGKVVYVEVWWEQIDWKQVV